MFFSANLSAKFAEFRLDDQPLGAGEADREADRVDVVDTVEAVEAVGGVEVVEDEFEGIDEGLFRFFHDLKS